MKKAAKCIAASNKRKNYRPDSIGSWRKSVDFADLL